MPTLITTRIFQLIYNLNGKSNDEQTFEVKLQTRCFAAHNMPIQCLLSTGLTRSLTAKNNSVCYFYGTHEKSIR